MGSRFSGNLAAALLVASLLVTGPAAAQLMNRAEPLPDITSAGQPTAADLEKIAAEGYSTVIDLRGADEDRGIDEKSIVESLGMRYVSLPISGAASITFENAATLDQILTGIEGPVLLHCASSNRVGGMLALREALKGASTEEALALGAAAGMSPGLAPAVKEQLDSRE